MRRKPYKRPDRRKGGDRRIHPNRRKQQQEPVGGEYTRELGRALAAEHDWLPPKISVPNERKGKDRRKSSGRRASDKK